MDMLFNSVMNPFQMIVFWDFKMWSAIFEPCIWQCITSLSVNLHVKLGMLDLQRYPWHLNLNKHLENTVVASCKQRMRNVPFVEKPQMKIISFKKQNHWYIIHIRQSFEGYRCKLGIAFFAWRVTWNYAIPVPLSSITLNL